MVSFSTTEANSFTEIKFAVPASPAAQATPASVSTTTPKTDTTGLGTTAMPSQVVPMSPSFSFTPLSYPTTPTKPVLLESPFSAPKFVEVTPTTGVYRCCSPLFGSSPKKTDVVKSKPEIPTTNKKESEVKGFGDKFVPKSGTWNCSVCYVNNSAGVIKCVACETLKPGEVAAPSTTPAIQMKFGMPPATSTAPATGFKITPSTTTTPASTGFSFSATPTTAANSFAGIKFGVPTSSVAQAVPAFSFSSASTAVTAPVSTPAFGVTPTKSTTATTAGYETPIMPSLVPITASASGFSFGTSKPVSITPLSSQVASLSLPPKRNSYRRPPTPSSPVFLDMPHEFIPSPPFKLTPKTAPQRKSETTAKVSAVGGSGGGQNKEDGEKKGDSGMLFSLLAQKTPSAGFNIAPNKVHLDIVKIIMSVM